MTDAKRKMHLGIQAAAPGHPAGWRMPGGERQAGDDVAHYQNVARICERALLDVLFLADSPSFTDDGRSPTRSLDPVVLITACALATEHLGLVLTASTTFSQPYNLARSLLTLDQVSRGRVGWNIVTTADAVASLNFGMTEMPSSDLRYEMAADSEPFETAAKDCPGRNHGTNAADRRAEPEAGSPADPRHQPATRRGQSQLP